MIVECSACAKETSFDQPYRYHAGFSNTGFLYNDSGSCTLVWSTFDPAYGSLVGDRHPWALDADAQSRLEASLIPSPSGGAWQFSNPPRCPQCGHPIGESIRHDIYYLIYPGSLCLDAGEFVRVLRNPAA